MYVESPVCHKAESRVKYSDLEEEVLIDKKH